MNKQEIVKELQQLDLSEDVKGIIVEYLDALPEELSNEDLVELDQLLADLQKEEVMVGQASSELADVAQQFADDLADNYQNTVQKEIKIMRDAAQQMYGIVGE